MSQEHRYSGKLSSKGSLLRETLEVMATLTGDSSLEDVRTLVIEDNILPKQTLETRGTIWRVIHACYFSGKDLSDIRTVACLVTSQLPEHHRHLILFYELAKSLPLVYDLTVDCLYKLYMEGRSRIDKADILA